MTCSPITITEPAIRKLMTGELTLLRRPVGPMLAAVAAGDRLWVREPFHLPAEAGLMAPTTAVARNYQPAFAADFGPGMPRPPGYGPRQVARSLPKAWHRQHLLVAHVEQRPLHGVTEEQALAEGYSSREQWIAAWDRGVTMTDSSAANPRRWAHNPTVLVIAFKRFASPVPHG